MMVQLDLLPLPSPPSRGRPLVALRLEGEPRPWQRPKPFEQGGRIVERFTGSFRRWRDQTIGEVATWWASREPVRVPVVAEVLSVFSRPDGPPKPTVDGQRVVYPWPWVSGRVPHLGLGDVDNCAKALLDVMQRVPKGSTLTPVLSDDRLVVELRASRWYAAVDEGPCVEVRLWEA